MLTGQIYMKYDIETSLKMCPEIPYFVKISQKYWTLYMKT
jgi:hypothetical protein